MKNRRNYHRRAEIIRRVVECLAQAPAGRAHGELIGASLALPAEIVERIVKRIALRGLARSVAPGTWAPSPLLGTPIPLEQAAA